MSIREDKVAKEIKCYFTTYDELLKKTFNALEILVASEVLPKHTVMICEGEFVEAYLINEELKHVIEAILASNRFPYSAGIYVGRLRKSKPYIIPSVDFLTLIYELKREYFKAVKIRDEGLKPFLYGKDVLKASVTECFPPLNNGDVIGVIGNDGYVYGVALSKVSDCNEVLKLNPNDVVATNVFDVGWFLRGETRVKEKKFKV